MKEEPHLGASSLLSYYIRNPIMQTADGQADSCAGYEHYFTHNDTSKGFRPLTRFAVTHITMVAQV